MYYDGSLIKTDGSLREFTMVSISDSAKLLVNHSFVFYTKLISIIQASKLYRLLTEWLDKITLPKLRRSHVD